MSKKDEPKTVKARVLTEGAYGKVNDVVEVSAEQAAASSDLDPHPEAVAYAESLEQNQPKAKA